ncbi:hypothetical protein QQS21_000155 [Conoideocrella luteorostrata]|uniref:Cadmium resistance transporter n=1 Tax=Conoideocrella luteorostrata TaxID=1105319 RepID=A0AAJ0G449_9HYPO|nr:hypothetical protein QQS21_000155 [Conoideocrella luteorostrata]
MQFGKAIGTACSSFAITNIDDIFVLVTFMAEASTSKVITPLKITIGQYVGFTIIMVISMIGFGVSLVLPSQPIGFLGFLPMLLGLWKMFELVISSADSADEEVTSVASMRSIFKVALVTLMNGGDNIGTYVPLFSQTKGAEIAVYVVVYYILLGVWCLAAFLVMKQRHVLRLAEKYANFVVPFLFVGLGIFIIVKAECYPWSIKHIDQARGGNLGSMIMAVVTTGLLLICIGAMFWWKWRKRDTTGSSSSEDQVGTALPSIDPVDVNQPSSGHAQQGAETSEKKDKENEAASPPHLPPIQYGDGPHMHIRPSAS